MRLKTKAAREEAGGASGAPSRSPLEVQRLRCGYGPVDVLFDIDITVPSGEMLAVVGPNGAGKSTLLRTIAGLHRPSSGQVVFDGVNLSELSTAEVVRRGVALVPENKGVFADMSVRENLEMGAYTLPADLVESRTDAAIAVFPRLGERLDQQAGSMSGGERQMLSIAKALLLEPRVLLIDELTLGLAPIIVDTLLEAVQALHATGTTIVLVEQSLNVAATVSERAVFMEKGEIVFSGKTAELLDRPELTKAVLFGGHAGSEV